MKTLSVVVWFAVLIALMHALRDIYGSLLRRRLVKLALAPGIVVFLFFQILACAVAGARIREIKPFDDKVELLQHERPGLGAVGDFLISVLPFTCLLIAFALLFTFLFPRPLPVPDLPGVALVWQAPGRFAGEAWDFVAGFFKTALEVAGTGAFWLLLYGAVTLLLTGAPGWKDLKYLAVAVALGALAALALEALKVRVGSGDVRAFVTRLVESFHFLLGAGVGWIAVSVVLVGSYRLLALNRSERKSRD